MRVVAIVQARMTSTRLPGKVLADLAGEPVLARVVARLRRAKLVDDVIVACTDLSTDDPIAAWCQERVSCFRGSETDVLGRFVGAANAAQAEAIVRITADCPLIDSAVVDRVIGELVQHRCDYASNVLERSYPRGLDTEAFTAQALARMDSLGSSASAREHVTIPVRLEHPEAFRVRSVTANADDSDLRWTVDTAEDLDWVRRLYRSLGLGRRVIDYREVVSWCRTHGGPIRNDSTGETWDPSRLASIRTRTE